MRIFVIGDVHWSQNSSIVRGMGDKYSIRLENLIRSINWAERKAVEEKADLIVYLGDFFDRPELNSMEITSLKEVRWSLIEHVFLVGNHEASTASLEFNSTNVLRGLGFKVLEEPVQCDGVLYLPYISDDRRKPLHEYVSESVGLVLSHNDIEGIRYGAFLSKNGFPLGDIESLHDSGRIGMFVNGHLHNHAEFKDSRGRVFLMNLGNITGQNLSEDAFVYRHQAMLVSLPDDGSPAEMELIENPEAFNFCKLDASASFPSILPPNAVMSI